MFRAFDGHISADRGSLHESARRQNNRRSDQDLAAETALGSDITRASVAAESPSSFEESSSKDAGEPIIVINVLTPERAKVVPNASARRCCHEGERARCSDNPSTSLVCISRKSRANSCQLRP